MKNIVVIGVSGGSASGKTTVVNRLKDICKDRVEILSHDYYYQPFYELTIEERFKINYDHPSAFDTQRLIEDVKNLKMGNAIERPVYSFIEYTRLQETVTVNPAKVIIVDGILIYENENLRDLLDIKVFVDTDADERLIRRIIRDVNERGRSLESVIDQYTTTVKPMHELYVEPYKNYADIIIPRGGLNDIAIEMLAQRIKVISRED